MKKMSKEVVKRDKEYRLSDIVIRSAEDDSDVLIVEGYAIVWEQETLIGSEKYGYYETIARNALDKAHMSDVVGRYNHNDTNYILGRTRNKSLELIADDYGLKAIYRLQKNVQAHVDCYNMVKSGLLDKQSFAFTVRGREIREDSNGKKHVRITDIDRLFDVSIVDVPAYDSSSIYSRSVDSVEAEFETLERASEIPCEKDKELEILKIMYRKN